MKVVLVTGASGFIGKNLCARLESQTDIKILNYSRKNSESDLVDSVTKSDFIFHLAGVNRPKDEVEFIQSNLGLTEKIVRILENAGKKTPILFTSSSQAELDNAYGKSKAAAEAGLLEWSRSSGSPVYIYRLPGVFGKWSRPNYNSVVATFCHNIAHNLPVSISDPAHKLTLVYIDDVIDEFVKKLDGKSKTESEYYTIPRLFEVTLADLKDRISLLNNIRSTLVVPDLEDQLNKYLYATFISYLATDNFSYQLDLHSDDRGWLAEFIKSEQFGQIFISKTKPGISRGDHWHHTKIEKFLVVEGSGKISFRNKVNAQDIISYNVNGDTPTVIDIPTGYVHSIKNVGETDLITLFWANEILDKNNPDTYYENVTDKTL